MVFHPGCQQLGADRLLVLHQAVVALLLDLFREVAGQCVGGSAADILIFEAAHARELRLCKPIEQELEVLLGVAGKADDEGRADGKVRQISRQRAMRCKVFS
jgi:hypothetical protein